MKLNCSTIEYSLITNINKPNSLTPNKQNEQLNNNTNNTDTIQLNIKTPSWLDQVLSTININIKHEAISTKTKVATNDSTNNKAFKQVINTIPQTKQSSNNTVKKPNNIDTTRTSNSNPRNTNNIIPDKCLQATNNKNNMKHKDKQFLNS